LNGMFTNIFGNILALLTFHLQPQSRNSELESNGTNYPCLQNCIVSYYSR
jgi:hypothetical protein